MQKNVIIFSLKIQIQTCIWQGLLLIVGFEKKIGQATLTYVPILVVCICTRITVLACCAARMGQIFSEVFVLKNLYLRLQFLFKKFAVCFDWLKPDFWFWIKRTPAIKETVFFLIGKTWSRRNHMLFPKGFGPNIMEAVGRR